MQSLTMRPLFRGIVKRPPLTNIRYACIRSVKSMRPMRLCASPEELPDISPELEKEIEESSEMIDEMVREINKSLFIDTATAYVSGDQTVTEQEIQNVLKITVEPRMKQLNPTFLPLLDSYILAAQESASEQDPNNNVLGILMAIKNQVLDILSLDLPEDLRVLESALAVSNADDRTALLRKHLNGDAQPQCDPSTIYATASRLIDDVQGDDGDNVADYRLLAKLCIIREELRMVLLEHDITMPTVTTSDAPSDQDNNNNSPPSSSSTFTKLQGVPRQETAFLKELLAVDQSERRRQLLDSAFKGEFIENSRMKIRAGAFLDSLSAIQEEMNNGGYSSGSNEERVLLRLEEIWRESFVVLEDIAGNATYSP